MPIRVEFGSCVVLLKRHSSIARLGKTLGPVGNYVPLKIDRSGQPNAGKSNLGVKCQTSRETVCGDMRHVMGKHIRMGLHLRRGDVTR